MDKMEDYLKASLNLKTIRSLGACGGGCISDARAYSTDVGEMFVKQNDDTEVSCLRADNVYLTLHRCVCSIIGLLPL